MQTIDVTYVLTCAADAVERFARDIAYEQTVEVPESVATAAGVGAEVVGQVADIEPCADGRFRVVIRYAVDLSGFQMSQLLNLLYGNISIQNKIRLVDVALPPALLERFAGPRFGVAGVRAALGVQGRPLLATAVKPRGAVVEHLVGVARDFALGGGDVIKDDHNLVDVSFGAFADRVRRCHAAICEANAITGRRTLYFPNVLPAASDFERSLDLLVELGVPGVLVCPFITGVETMRAAVQRRPLMVMTHPSLAGTFFHDPDHGIEPAVLLGRLLRLAGADASVYPNHGGRFAFSVAQCAALSRSLLDPLGELRPALPAPAGGMRFESIPQMAELYGPDAIFLIGGALLGYSASLRDSTAAFLERIRTLFPQTQETPPADAPAAEFASSCELPSSAAASALRELLRFRPDFTWEGRDSVVYKASEALPFKDVGRTELLGRAGEACAFDLRYFEIRPDGFTSLERHQHVHAVVAIRGAGVLISAGRREMLRPFDVAYVPPQAVHQLRNEANEPFGFLCIVDRERDRPQAP